MMFTSLYRGSFYLMLILATLTMSIDATDSKISMLFPVAVAIGGFVALLTVDRRPSYGLPRPAANGLAMCSIGLVLLEYLIDPNLLLLALAHFLVYLQLIKMFLPKTPEDDWFLLVLGLMQVLVGAVISQSDRVGMMMFAWAFSTLWVLTLFSLHRDALRYRVISGPADPAAAPKQSSRWVAVTAARRETADDAASVPDEPYPGLLDVPFVLSGLRVTALTLALGGVIFLAMPRRGTAARPPQASDPLAGHLTGFDDEIQLGQLGEILENDSVVMSVEFFDDQRRKIGPPAEPLWRGVTMSTYEKGRWHRERRGDSTFPFVYPGRVRTRRQSVKLEASDSPVLFGLRPILSIKAGTGRNSPEFNSFDGTFMRAEMRSGALDYEILSSEDADGPQPGEQQLSSARIGNMLAVPDELRPRLKEITEPIVANIPVTDTRARARALEEYLRSSGQFSYSLRMTVVDPNVDPVEDFLVNRKEGHCEYYASALTLMIRSIGIPCRMVNGFKGGDWNELAGVLNVRQKHAHSWVEAYLHDTPNLLPLWLTLDPTPALERQRSVDRVGGFGSNFRQFTDFIRYIWVFFVVGYNSDRQHRLLYDPIRELIREARSGFTMMGQAIRPAIANLLYFKNVGQFISVRGLIVSFTGLLLLSGLFWLARWVVRRILRWYRGGRLDSASLAAGVVFYRRLTQLLAEFGLERPPAETQQEFAGRALVFLTGQGSQTQSVADVPRLVVDAFYRVRFGHLTLTPEWLTHLETRLDALEASLRSQDA